MLRSIIPALLFCSTALLSAANVAIPENGCYLSAFTEDGIESFEALVGKKQAIAMFYTNWEEPFPRALCDDYAANGNIPHLSWEPYRVGGVENDPGGINENSNAHIIAGDKDAYIRQYAQDVAAFGKPLFIRFALEMNGDWYEWGGAWSGKDTMSGYGDPAKYDGAERFVDAWRHIHDIFLAEGANNVSWVFAPNVSDEPAAAWNRMELYYPGAAYVDWLAIDGYNWGGSGWQSFDEVFAEGLPRVEALGSQPLMIAEFASSSTGGDKAAWISETYAAVKENYPRIKALTWFHIIKEEPWGVNTSPADLAAFSAAIADPYFLDTAASAGQTGVSTVGASAAEPFMLLRTGSRCRVSSTRPGSLSLSLTDMKGRLIGPVQVFRSSIVVDLAKFAPGEYLLRLKDGSGMDFCRSIQIAGD